MRVFFIIHIMREAMREGGGGRANVYGFYLLEWKSHSAKFINIQGRT